MALSYTTSRGQTVFLDGGTYGESALPCHDVGWRPIPLVHGKKVPPMGLRYKRYREEPLPRDQVVSWVKAYPDCDIAFLTGRGPDHFVIDVDERNDGLRTLHSMPELGDDMYHTLLGYSPNGLHGHFRLGGQELPSTHDAIGPGIDTKGEGGYVKVPPSAGYGFYKGGLVPLEEVPVLPGSIVELLSEHPLPKTPVGKGPRVPEQKVRERELKAPNALSEEFSALFELLGVKLVPGKTRYHCPWHDDQHPSLEIDVEKQVWYCHAFRDGGGIGKLRDLVGARTLGDVGVSPLHTHTPTTVLGQTPTRCPNPKYLYGQDKIGSQEGAGRWIPCGGWWCEACGPGVQERLARAYLENFARFSSELYAMVITEKVAEKVAEALYTRLKRHGHQYWAIPQGRNGEGLKTYYVVTDGPEGVLLKDKLKEVLLALERQPKGKAAGCKSASGGVRVPEKEPDPTKFRQVVNPASFRSTARALGTIIDEDDKKGVVTVKMPAFGDPDWQATFDLLRKRGPLDMRVGRPLDRESFFRVLGLSPHDPGSTALRPGQGEPGAPQWEAGDDSPK